MEAHALNINIRVVALPAPGVRIALRHIGNPPDKPKSREVEFSKKEVLREEVKIYRQPDHGCIEAC